MRRAPATSLGLLAGALLAGACASAARQEGLPEKVDWEARAAAAEAARSWEELAFALDRMPAARHPEEDWSRRRVRAAEGAGDAEAAARFREPLLSAHPEDLLLHVDQADDLQRLGRTEEALAVLEPFLRDPATRLAGLQGRGEILARAGRPAAAAAAFEEAARAADGDVAMGLWQRASRLREAAGDRQAALEDLQQALAGVDLSQEEQRVAERIRAWESGRPENVADAAVLLQHHPDEAFRLRAARLLASRSFPGDVELFLAAVGDPSPAVAALAVRAAARRGGEAVLPALLPLLEHPDTRVFVEAVRAVASRGSLGDVPALLAVFDAADRSRFRAVRGALEALTGEAIGLELDPGPERRQEIVNAWRDWWRNQEKTGGTQPRES